MSLVLWLLLVGGSSSATATVGVLYHRAHAELNRNNQIPVEPNYNDLRGSRYGGFERNYPNVVPTFDVGRTVDGKLRVIEITKTFAVPFPGPVSYTDKQVPAGNVASLPQSHIGTPQTLSPFLFRVALPLGVSNSAFKLKQSSIPPPSSNAYAVRQNLDFDLPKAEFLTSRPYGSLRLEQLRGKTPSTLRELQESRGYLSSSQPIDNNGIGDFFGDHRSLRDFSDYDAHRSLTGSRPFRPSQEYTPPEMNRYSHS